MLTETFTIDSYGRVVDPPPRSGRSNRPARARLEMSLHLVTVDHVVLRVEGYHIHPASNVQTWRPAEYRTYRLHGLQARYEGEPVSSKLVGATLTLEYLFAFPVRMEVSNRYLDTQMTRLSSVADAWEKLDAVRLEIEALT